MDKYEKLICSGDNNVFTLEGYGDDIDDYCHRIDDIMRDHNTSDYWDPHKCRDSCQNPGYGCRACSNPDYFRCTKNNISVCVHPDLKCNLHPDCDNAEDEKFKDCKEPYVEKKLIENFATLRCTSTIYPNSSMEIIATVCDGVTECSGGVDEPSSCKRSGGSNRVLGLSVGSILVFYLTLLFHSKLKRNQDEKKKNFMTEIIQSNETDITLIRQKLNIFGLHVEHYYGKKTKEKVGLKIFALEAKQKNVEADIFSRLHNHYLPEVGRIVIDSRFPGLTQRFFPIVLDILDYISKTFHTLILLGK